MQNAKYADKMKWFLLWENSSPLGFGSAEQNLDAFLKYIAPYWIEYYIKDPNYYRINDRPVVGIYYFWSVQSDFTSDTKAGLDKFRQMCIDAGVGDPYILQDRDVLGSDSETHLKQMGQWGVDLHAQYHQADRYIEETIRALDTAKDIIVKNNLDIQSIPVITPGFDDYAWGLNVGILWDQDMLRSALEYVRDEYYKDLPMKTGRKMLLLTTWDEYAEGHYYAPTVGKGFQFLDVVRETFAGGGEHEDILPTEHQLDRFNNRYPSWRDAPFTIEAMVSKDIPENSYVKKTWDFNTDGDFEGWKNAGGFSNIEVKDGYLKAKATGGRGTISFEANEEYSDVLQVRVKYKNLSSAFESKFYYKNQFMSGLLEKTRIREHINPNGDGEVVFTTEKYPLDWKGIVETMQLAFEPMNAGEEIYIDSIELIAKHMDDSKMKISLNGYVSETDGIAVSDNEAMVPIRDLAWIMRFDDRAYYDSDTNTVMYRSYSDNKLVIMPLDGDKFTINGEEYESEKFYNCKDGTCRVSTAWAAKVFGKESYYDSESNTFYITDKILFVPERNVEEREIVWSADFDSGMDGFGFGQDVGGRVEDGKLKLKSYGVDPQFINNSIGAKNISCEESKVFAIKTTAKAPCQIKVYFSTSTHPGVSESNAFYFDVPASEEPQISTCDISNWVNWDGTLTYMRVDVEEEKDNSLDIEYLRFYGDFETEISDEELSNLYSSIEKDDKGIRWEFSINNAKDGWIFNKSIANISVSGGTCVMDVIGKNPEMLLCGDVAYEADEIKEIQLGIKALNGEKAKLLFATEESKNFSEDKSFTIEFAPDQEIYSIKTQNNSEWKGNITGFKLIPTDSMGKVSIDFIRLIKK